MVGAFLVFQGRSRRGASGRDAAAARPALVPQATLKPAESPEFTERAERAELRKQENPSTLTTMGTYKIYAESFKGEEHLKQVQAEAQEVVSAVLNG